MDEWMGCTETFAEEQAQQKAVTRITDDNCAIIPLIFIINAFVVYTNENEHLKDQKIVKNKLWLSS